jgi:1,4-alpha-glucan branching enzyme
LSPQAAALFGDFSGWKEVWMTRDKWGVWEVSLPDGALRWADVCVTRVLDSG